MVRRFSSTVEASDLRLARTLLQKARPELEQRQWDLLNEKLLAVEQAWERYEAARPAESDQREKASSPSLALAGMGAAAEGASLAPLLVLLAAFWSADTAGPGMDPPRWQGPLLDYEGKLRELSEAAKQVQLDVEASRGRRHKVDASVPCPPCTGSLPPSRVDSDHTHYPCPGEHVHYWVWEQNPSTCQCFMKDRLACL